VSGKLVEVDQLELMADLGGRVDGENPKSSQDCAGLGPVEPAADKTISRFCLLPITAR